MKQEPHPDARQTRKGTDASGDVVSHWTREEISGTSLLPSEDKVQGQPEENHH